MTSNYFQERDQKKNKNKRKFETYDPNAQTVAEVAPTAQLEPAGHVAHDEAPVDEEKLPAAHDVETPDTQKFPIGQVMQLLAEAAE